MQPLDETDAIPPVHRAGTPSPFDQPALMLLGLQPTAQRKTVYAILDEIHIVHGGSKPLVKTACAIMRCALRLHQDNDPLAIDRVLLWCFEWIRERAR